MKTIKLLIAGLFIASQFVSAQFKQTPLAYAYNALEPYVDAETMEIHYTKHAAGYVSNLNKAIAGTPMENEDMMTILSHISKESPTIRNNAGGHYNHELFWTILTPEKNTHPSEKLEKAITESFGSLDALKEKLSKAGAERFGSGWAWLIVTPDKKLAVTSSPNQDNPLMDIAEMKGTPILGIDVWEHAYYLKYQNKRADYLTAFWNVVNWNEVSRRYEAATKGRFDDWQALKDFHDVMSQTFHPAEEGNLQPIKKRVGELLNKAQLLKSSSIPTEFNKTGVKNSLEDLVKSIKELKKQINKKASDTEITKSLGNVHDTFHTIIGLCTAEDKH